MRTFRKPNYDWTMSYIELNDICKEVYGVPYDLQMGERGQGEYDIVTTGQIEDREGYSYGLGQGYRYEDKYIDGHDYYYFDEGKTDSEGNYIDVIDKAIAYWQTQEKTISYPGAHPEYDRPFNKVGENGRYTFWQPSLETVMTDLANKKEIPEGTYMITIDW